MIESAPWIWPMMMSLVSLGTWATDSAAVSVCGPLPASKLLRLLSSVRGCAEFLVVAPTAGAQNVRLPSGLAVSHGGVAAAGWMIAALPFLPSSGMVSFQPSRLMLLAGPGCAGAAGGAALG